MVCNVFLSHHIHKFRGHYMDMNIQFAWTLQKWKKKKSYSSSCYIDQYKGCRWLKKGVSGAKWKKIVFFKCIPAILYTYTHTHTVTAITFLTEQKMYRFSSSSEDSFYGQFCKSRLISECTLWHRVHMLERATFSKWML